MRVFDSRVPGWPINTPTLRLASSDDASRVQQNWAEFSGPTVRLRPLQRKDGKYWRSMRIADEQYLRPVEPTIGGDWREAHTPAMWRANYKGLQRLARNGDLVPAAIEVDGRFAGQLTLGNIQHGIVSNCWIGYWVYSGLRGQGIATAAVALGTDFAMHKVGLHRVEATVMADNPASQQVLATTGFRQEGVLHRNLHINGQWQDHILVAQTVEEATFFPLGGLIQQGIVQRLAATGRFEIL